MLISLLNFFRGNFICVESWSNSANSASKEFEFHNIREAISVDDAGERPQPVLPMTTSKFLEFRRSSGSGTERQQLRPKYNIAPSAMKSIWHSMSML